MSIVPADRLTYMANQIARFFAAQPRSTAAAEVAKHLREFWAPAMRAAIISHLHEGGEGLSPVATDAVRLLQADPASGARTMPGAGHDG